MVYHFLSHFPLVSESETPAEQEGPRFGEKLAGPGCSPEGIAEQDDDGTHVLGLVVAVNHRSRLPAVGAAAPKGKDGEELRESGAL